MAVEAAAPEWSVVMTKTIGDRSLHAKAVAVDADTDKSVIVAARSKAGKRMVLRLDPHPDWHLWSAAGVELRPGDSSIQVRTDRVVSTAGESESWSVWPVVAFVSVGDDGEPVMEDDGTGRAARELAASWLGCEVGDLDALFGLSVLS